MVARICDKNCNPTQHARNNSLTSTIQKGTPSDDNNVELCFNGQLHRSYSRNSIHSTQKQLKLQASQPLLGMAFNPDLSKSSDEIQIRSEPEDPVLAIDSAAARKVLRKIDYHIIPLLFITYNLNFMDKTILSSASVFGLGEDTNLKGQQYSWVSSIFYFGYFFWEYPTTWLIQKLPVGKYVGVNTIL
jgi:hypothetical protein